MLPRPGIQVRMWGTLQIYSIPVTCVAQLSRLSGRRANAAEILIQSDDTPIARLSPIAQQLKRFPDLSAFRALVSEGRSAADLIREMGDDERY